MSRSDRRLSFKLALHPSTIASIDMLLIDIRMRNRVRLSRSDVITAVILAVESLDAGVPDEANAEAIATQVRTALLRRYPRS